MNILAIRPSGGTKTLAYFDVELTPDIRAYGFELRRTADGRLRVISPRGNGKNAITLTPELSSTMTAAARVALAGGIAAHART